LVGTADDDLDIVEGRFDGLTAVDVHATSSGARADCGAPGLRDVQPPTGDNDASWQVWSQQRGDAASYDAITADDQQVPSHW